ncbi:MAG: SdpI family protein, partial [Kiritimatiellae bacterium]|nr:SdpI family protein [Kiritimatiellia bacterium]
KFYGYRTTCSRKSQEAWNFAQRYSAKLLTIFGFTALIVAVAASMCGCVLAGTDTVQTRKPAKPKVKLSELQRRRHLFQN